MLRASKTLLCAVAVDVSLASRQTGAVINVMDSIGSLLQTHKARANGAVHSQVLNNLFLLASTTPGQSASLTEALTKVIAEIELNVDTKIRASFAATGDAIEVAVDNLKTATDTAVDEKNNADNGDNVHFNCVRTEKSKREAIEEADERLRQARSNDDEPCQLQADNAGFTASPQLAAFVCDISTNGNCNEQLTNYKTLIGNVVTAFTEDLSEKQKIYGDHKIACDAAVAETLAKSNAHDDSIAAWENQKTTCQNNLESAQQLMCLFGTSLQRKCVKAAAYTNLIAEVDLVNGGEHSQPDLEQEWKTTQVTKCMLTKVMDGGLIDAAVLDVCDADVNFAVQVGVLDRRDLSFADQMTAERFTCLETAIPFEGQTWNVPEGDAPPSSDYTTTDYAPMVDLTENSSPFEFCQGK